MPDSLYKESPTVVVTDGRPRVQNDQEGVSVSATGPVVIPNWLVPYFLAGAGALAIVGDEVADPGPWTTQRGIGLVVKLLGYFGLGATQGLRRK
jgi:hypothetical protein